MSRKPRPRVWLVPCVVVLMLAWAAGAAAQQTGGGTLTGSVLDRDGVVPGATVTVTAEATNTTRTVVTNETGLFRLPGLAPGQYTIKVEMSGFSPITMNQIQLQSGAVRDVGKLTLAVGQMNETVVVTAAVTPVQVSTSTRKGEITADELQNIQMKGRDIYGMLAIIPGVQDTNFKRDFTDWNSAKLTTINGAPVNNKSLMIDGINVMDEGGTGNAFVNPNIDAVGEVQVIANGFTAENGRNNGGLINFITKSGTNRYTGSAWYNMRRDSWNANDYLRIRNKQAKPLYRVNIPGFSFGGPVIIPRIIDSRTSQKKVFFFISQEYTDDARPTTTSRANVATAKERVGDFSETRLTNGNIQPIIDPQTGVQFPGNIIPANRINQLGQRLVNLVQTPNGYVSAVASEVNSYNYINNQTPLHNRTNHVIRVDADATSKTRISAKLLADREDNILFNQWGPGQGAENNFVPGWVLSGTATTVIRPTLVNEMNAGFSINHYGFRSPSDNSSYPGGYRYEDYFCAALNACTPRIQPYGTGLATYDAKNLVCCGFQQSDQYPYVAIASYSGGNRPNLAGFSPGGVGGRVMPSANRNHRYQFQNDLTKVAGRHSFKMGVYFEIDSKTEPGTTNYMGNFNFGSTTTNPFDTGNGYANALLGIFQTYTEVNKRVDKDVRHWQNEFYLQDSWKVNPRLTFDYGARFTHSGPFYEIHDSTAAFYPELYDPAKAPRIYRQACTNAAIQGNQTCPASQRVAIDPNFPNTFVNFAYAGNFVPGTGDPYNGMLVNGLGSDRIGKGDKGQYWYLPYLVAAPRLGMAWDVNGDGKMALRSSFGVFYNFPRGQPSQFVGTAPVSITTTVRNATMDQLANFSSGQLVSTTSPINSGIATLEGQHYNLPISYEANIAFQRDIGFNTVVDVAWVGNFITNDYRTVNLEVLPLYVFASPKNQYNGAAISANYLRTKFPGMGNVTDTVTDTRALEYHSFQVGVKRRLSHGLQMGLAYTLSKGMGMRGYDDYTADPNITMVNVGGSAVRGGEDALRARYWGPTTVDRRHNLVVHYSYDVPAFGNRLTRWALGYWQVSGVTKFITGTAVDPSCSSTNAGLANTDPTYTLGNNQARCMLTGEPIFGNIPTVDDPLEQLRFNPAAFKMAAPVSATVGNFGDAPLGLLRNPSWTNWDLTIARRFPLQGGSRAGIRLQFQMYNVFNQVNFTTLNAALQFTGANNSVLNSTTTGKYSQTGNDPLNPPRQFGITARIDF